MTNTNAVLANDTVCLKDLSELESDAMDLHSLLEGLQILTEESDREDVGKQAANAAYLTLRIALEKAEALTSDIAQAALAESRADQSES